MNTIYSATFLDEIKMPAQNIQALIESYAERQKSGLIRLGYASDKQLYFLYKRGELINTYLVTPEKWEAFTAHQGMEWALAAGDAFTKTFAISAFGLLMAKLLIETHDKKTEALIQQKQIADYLAAANLRPEASLVCLVWKNAAGAIFFAPNKDPHYNFISQEIMLDKSGVYKIFYEWDELQCAAASFTPDLTIAAWQEYYLRDAFANVCERILSRFEILTGRALVDSLVRLVAVHTARQNLNITITARKIEDLEVFPSPQDAALKYRLLLAEISNHFSAVIGLRLHASTMREIVKNLPRQDIEIMRSFMLLPKGYFNE